MEGYNHRLIDCNEGETSHVTPRTYSNTAVGVGNMTTAILRKITKNVCSKSFLERKIPIVKWLPRYNGRFLIHDIIAGLTVGLTAIPQGIANAVVAGLEPQYGLYSGFMGAFVYIFLGSCKDITIGPTALLALMVQKNVEDHGPDFAVLICFLSGCIIFLLGVLQMGFLVDFISMPVTVGFTSASAITIASAQVKSLLGLSGKSNEFLEAWINVFENIQYTQLWDTLLGVLTIIVLVLAKKLKDFQIKGPQLTTRQNVINKIIWLVSLGRNALVAIIGTAAAYIFYVNGLSPFKLTGNIGEGMPPFELPPFSTISGNTTYYFSEMVAEMGTSIVTIPLISILESIAIAKAFSKGKVLDATQEMVALGMCNILGSFVRSIPVTGSFTRTSVNHASGVETPMGGLFTGALVLLALGLLTSTFTFIPKATLAGIIIAAMFYMVEYEMVPLLWRTKKLDLIPLIVTFLCCLFWGLEYGILVGVGLNLLVIIYTAARPRVNVKHQNVLSQEVILVMPDQSLFYPAAEYVRAQIIKSCVRLNSTAVVVLDGRNIRHIDATMAKVLQLLTQDLKAREQRIILWNWNKSGVESCIGIDPKLKPLFRDDESLEQLIREVFMVPAQIQDSGEEAIQDLNLKV